MKKPQTKYEFLSDLLGAFGRDTITREVFWAQMKQRGYTQDDIDQWCERYYQLEKEKDDAREREEQDGREGGAAARNARGPYRQEQAVDRQAQQTKVVCRSAREDVQEAKRPGTLIIELPQDLKDRAIYVGEQRHDFAVRAGYVNYGAQPGKLKYSVDGAVGERGIAHHYDEPWHENIGIIDGIDVGRIVEVRGRTPGSDLGIRPADKRYLPHVLVWVYPDYSMLALGWLYGIEGMYDEDRWNENSKCWYNPPPYRPLDELARILADESKVEYILKKHREDEPRRKDVERKMRAEREAERQARELANGEARQERDNRPQRDGDGDPEHELWPAAEDR